MRTLLLLLIVARAWEPEIRTMGEQSWYCSVLNVLDWTQIRFACFENTNILYLDGRVVDLLKSETVFIVPFHPRTT